MKHEDKELENAEEVVEEDFSPTPSPMYPSVHTGNQAISISRSTSSSNYNDNNITETYDSMIKGFLG